MAGSDQTAKVTLIAVTAPYTKGMTDASRATDKLGKDIDRTGESAKGFGTKVNAAKTALIGLAAAGGAVAGTALVKFLSDSVRAAGDLEQSIGGVDSVFGEAADQVHTFGETSAQSVGLSRNAFNELITVTGALLKNQGLTDFTERSLELVQVGADLAATFGGSTAQAVEALNAAMRGESDPIERYGISLNMAAVNAELASKGLTGLTGAARDQAVAQARLDIIMRQSADASGQFAREVDTLQGQQQRLNAEWENAKASIGEALLPAMTAAVKAIREGVEVGLAIADAFGRIPTPVWAAVAAFSAIHLLGGPLARFGAGIATTMRAASEAMVYARLSAERAGGGFAGAAAGLRTFTGSAGLAATAASGLRAAGSGLMTMLGGPWGIALMGAATVVGVLIGKHREHKASVDEVVQSLDAESGAVTENTERWVVNEMQKSGAADAADRLGIPLETLRRAMMGEADALESVNAHLDEHREKLATTDYGRTTQQTKELRSDIQTLGGAVDGTNGIIGEAREKLEQAARAMGETSPAAEDAAVAVDSLGLGMEHTAVVTEDYADALDEVAEQAERTKKMHDDLIDSLLEAVDAAYGAQDAAIAYEASLDELTDTIAENGKTHDIGTEKGRNNQKALLDLGQAALANAEANLANGKSLLQVHDDMEQARSAFIRGAEQMGYTTSEANALADQLGLTTGNVNNLAESIDAVPSKSVAVRVTGTDEAGAAVDKVKGKINALTGKTVYVNIISNYQSKGQMPANSKYSVGLAGGGKVPGPYYGPTADNVLGVSSSGVPLARINPREWIQPVASVDYYGEAFMRAIQHRAIPRDLVRFANGGQFGGSQSVTPISVTAPSLDIDYDRLAAAMSTRPINTAVQVGSRQIAYATREGNHSIGAPRQWAETPVIGGRRP